MIGLGSAVLANDGELRLWSRRYDDSEGATDNLIDGARIWLGRHVPSLKPGSYSRTAAFETVPWKAAECVRTNGVAPDHAMIGMAKTGARTVLARQDGGLRYVGPANVFAQLHA